MERKTGSKQTRVAARRRVDTFILEVSEQAYWEIRSRLEVAGYNDRFIEKDGKIFLDMRGIGLVTE